MPDNKLDFLLNYKKPISQSNSNIDLLINRNQSQQKVNQAVDELPVFLNNREDLTLDPNKYETRFQTEFTDAVNSFRRGIDQTQISNYQGKLDAHQEVIDDNVDKKNKLIDLHKQGKINSLILGAELQKIEQENNKAFTEISKYQSDIEDNKLEMQDEYVSKMYQMKEALVQAKGGDAGLWESIKYTMPSTAGSSASLMGQQIAATWGTGLIKKIITSAGAGAIGGPLGEAIAVGGTILTTAALIGNSRYQETMAEIGGQLEQNQQKLLENWQEQNPGLEPDEEVLRQIRMAARKGKDEMFKEQMMLGFWDGAQALLAPGSKVLGAFKTGRKLEKAVEKITDYNKYTRAGSTLGKFYIGQKSEGFEEGFQYATSKRQEDAALGLGLYENKDFMTNLLTDSYDTVSSMDFGPFKGDGRYADDKEFQFSVKSGELLSMLPGAVATAKSMYDDISTYRKTNKELQQSGIANPEDKFFKLKDQIYVRHFDNNTVSYLLEGVRNLGNQKNEKGIPYLNETEVQAETKNIQEAFDKYLEVSKHIEDIIPEGRFNIKYSPEQVVKIAALKSELFHSSMNLTRYAHKFPTIETVSNINNLIKHNENLIKEIQSTLNSDYTLRNVYHLNDRLSLAQNKLTELNDLKKQFLEGSNLEEKDIPEINSVEESNKNKEYVINDLNLSEEKKKYEELLKVKDNETLDIWFDNFIKKQKTKKKEITKQESKIKLAQETDVNLFAQDVFNKVKDPAAEENIEFYNANKEAIDKQIAILQAAKDKKAVKDVFGDPIDEEEPEDFDNIDYNKVAKVKSDEKEGKKAETVNKTELGWDGDIFIIQGEKYGIVDLNGDVYTLKNIKTNFEIYVKAKDLNYFKGIAQYPSQERLFRFTENSDNIEDYELAAITKRNNPELYNELLDLQENELNKDGLNARQTDEEDSIYFVLVDKNHNPVLVDGVKLFSYMTRPERYTKKELNVTEEDVEKLKENRELILNSNDILFFNVIDKSDGTLGFESKDDNERVSKPVVGTIYDNINEVELEVVTLNASTNPENTYGFLSKLPGKIASLGRLYAIFKNQAVDLIPRTLNDKEINKIAELLLDKLNNKPDISKEIEKLIFFGYGRKEENPTRVAVSKGILYLGNDITMNKNNFDIEVVKQFLKDSGKKVTVNKSYLESNKKFKDIFGVEHKSYQSYLLTGENRLYGTDLKDKGEGQLLNQYLIYNPTPNKNMNKLTSSLPEVNTEAKEDSTDVLNTPSQVNPDSSTTEDKKTDIKRKLDIANNEYDLINYARPGAPNRTLDEQIEIIKNLNKELAALETKDGSYTANAKAVIEAAKSKTAEEKPAKKTFENKKDTEGLTRLASISKDKRELTKEEIDWFVSKFPNIPIEIVKGLIEAKSLGQFLQSGKVLLSDKATYGTLYHEAFHVVTQLYLTKKEIDNLYAEALKNNPGKTRLELEEILAEDFINYKETGQVLKGAPTRNTLFRRLVNFVKDLLQLSAKDIKDVYRRIDTGYYTNKKRINNQEFGTLNKLADKTEQETKEILDGFTAMFFKILKTNEKTTLDAYKYKDAVLNVIFNRFNALYKDNPENETFYYILDNFETIANTWVKKMNSLGAGLKEYNVIIENKTISEEDEGTDTSVVSEEEKSRQDNGYTEANLTSVKSKMFNSTKFLIRGLVQVDKEGSEKLSSIGLPIPVDFDKTYSYLLKNLVGLGNDYEVYYNKLTELAKEKPELNQLKDVLKAPNQIENLHTVLQQTQFVQDFNKNKVVSYITLIEEEGKKIYLIDATKQAVSEGIKDKWAANLKSISKQNNEGKLIINLESLKGSNNVEYLAKLGLVFSPETIKKIEKSEDFNNAVQAVRNYLIKNNGNVTTLFEDRDIKNRINTLAFLESEFTPDTIELSYMNSENKTVYSIAYNNYLSALKNKINNSDNLADLYAKVPHLQSVTSENSYWISKLFDANGKRDKSVNIDLNLQDGLKNKDTETGTSTSGLTIGDKLVQEINSTLLNGLTSFIRASDKATEHTISLSGVNKLPIDLDEFKDGFDIDELKEIFQGYFQSEFKRIALFKINKLGSDIDQYNKSGDKWTTFSFISSELKDKLKEEINKIKSEDLDTEQLNDRLNTVAETYYDDIDAEVIEFFNNYLIKQKAQLAENKITLDSGISSELKGAKITKLEQELENAELNGFETLSISKRLDNEKAKRLDQLLRALIVTDLINSIEQTKIFTGDMAFYKDLFKRMSGLTGGKEFCRNDEFLNNFLNKNNKRLDKKLADGNINVTVFSDVNLQSNYLKTYQKALETSGLTPKEASDLMKAYTEMEEGDGQGWITMDEYREFMIRLGDWDNLKESTWEKLQRNEPITSEEMVYFISKKAQYFGPQEYDNQLFAPTFHKFSLMPLIPSLIKGTNMEVLLETMQKPENQTGYALFKSGTKVGAKVDSKGEPTKFYTNTNEGEINTKDWIKQVISYEYLGLQQKSSKPHDTVIFGTQFRKLVLSNLFESGVVNENFSEAKELLEEYNKIINDLITKEKDKLVKELGLNPALNYVSEDATKLVELLKSEAENRALPANLIDSLQVTQDTKTLRYKFDSMVNKAKIDSMLMSIINSRLIRQKMNGDALIQGASSGFEPRGVRIKEDNTLKFYTQEGPDGITTHAEVMIAMNDNYRPLLNKYNGDLDALNKAIEGGKVDKRLLQMIGYRIPTQGLNSMDMLQVKKFLPESSATLIILPTDIVAKSGGDYDIDKMNVFRFSMYLDEKTNEVKIYKNSTKTTEELFTDIQNEKSNLSELIREKNVILDIEYSKIQTIRERLAKIKDYKKADLNVLFREKEYAQIEFNILKDEIYSLVEQSKLLDNPKLINEKNKLLLKELNIKILKNLYNSNEYNQEFIKDISQEKIEEINNKLKELFEKMTLLSNIKSTINDKLITFNLEKTAKKIKTREIKEKTLEKLLDFSERINESLQRKEDLYRDMFNWKEGKTNRLIEISTKILQHPSNFNALTIPNSTKILTDLVAEIRWIEHVNDKPEYKGTIEDYEKSTKNELKNIKYIEQLMLSTKTKQFQKLMLAKDMIGVAAVQNTAHIIAQLAGLTLNKTYIVKTKEGKKIEKNRHISFKHHTGPNNTMDLGKTFDVNGKNKISEVISQIINATVDAARDPFLIDLNMDLTTLGTYAYLIRIGVPFDTVVYFMKQPIISKYLKSLSINQSEFLGLNNQEAKGKALAEAKNEFILDDAEYGNEYLETKVYENEELKSYLSKDKQVGDDFKANQLHILNKFLEYQDQASMLSDSIKANNHDTAGLGKSLYTSFMKRTLNAKVREDNFVNNLENLVNTPIAGFNQIDFSIDAFSQFYDSYSNRTIKNNIDKILNNLKLFKDEDIIKTRNLIENDFINYVVQNYGYDNISKYSEELFKSQSVAKQLLKIKNNPETTYEIALSNNMLVKELFPLINKVGDNKDNIKIYSRKYDTFTADQLTEAFKELEELGQQENQRLFEESGNIEDLNKPTLAKQIMDVGIIQSGLNNSPITYLGIIPFEYYNELVKESFDNFYKKNGAQEMYKFEQLFQRENPGGKPKKGWIYGKNYDINSKQEYQVPTVINEPVVTQTNETTDNFKNSFEYNNLKVETDFQLSEDQDNALRQLIDFIKDRNKSVVTLEGAAGTGKTSIIGYLQKYLGRSNSFAYLAPTHAATVQLAFNTAKIGNKDFPATLASAISIDPKTGRNKFSVKIQKRLGLNPVIVVDESSMIDNSDIDKLLEAIEDIGGKLILMGDEKQIPKVSIVDSLTKQLSGAFTRFEKIKLSKVHRQSNNKLLNILNKMREQISFKLFKTANSEAVKFVNKREYNELLVNDLLTDPENTMVISYTNDGVKGINNQARKVLGREGETQVGDIIVGYLGYASKQVEKSDIANSINYTITKIEADGPTKIITAKSDKLNELVKLGIKGVTNTATTTYYQMDGNDSLQFDDLTQEEFEMNNDLVSNYFRDINKANIDYANKQITYFSYQTIIASISESLRKVSVGQDYIYNPETDRMEILDAKKHSKIKQNGQGSLKMNKDIDYGHAITIHKSQGSTINNVYFDTSSLNPERDIKILDENGIQITTEKMALAYVAMSRSKNKLVVYEHNLDFELLEDTPETPTQVVDNEIDTREYTPENITSLKPNEVFVFGSNAEGAHGKGAALIAKQKFGAIQGQAEGLQGQSYAIITKKDWRVEKSSTLTEIGNDIMKFVSFASVNPEKKFYVTKIGSSLAGYSIAEIKNLWKQVNEVWKHDMFFDIPDNIILPKEFEVRQELKPNVVDNLENIKINNPAEYTNHSGGAKLSDAAWDIIGREFGVTQHRHYREPGQTTVDSLELQKAGVKATPLDETTYNEGQPKATVAARQMGRIEPNFQIRSNYIIRNWAQVKNADAIFAIGTIIPKGTLMSNNKTALIEQVKGGTGYAVQMAINEGKPVFVYDGTKNSWFKWNGKTFEKTITPTLTKNFAGIGSRSLSTQEVIDKSYQAIRDVYENTFKATTQLSTSVKVIPLNESQRFTRESAEKDTEYMYLFTDNAGRTSGSGIIDPNSWYAKKYGADKKYASKTQAVARGLNNVYPITTMVDDKRTQWTDAQFDTYKKIIDDEIKTIKQASSKYKGIKFGGEMPFGQGAISNMKDTAPKIWNYLNTKLAEIGIDNTGNTPKVITNSENISQSEENSVSLQDNSIVSKFKIDLLDMINQSFVDEDMKNKAIDLVNNTKVNTEKDMGDLQNKICNLL
jgi:hypothetical protein